MLIEESAFSFYRSITAQLVFMRPSLQVDFSDRSQEEFVHGFGDPEGEHWLGLKHLVE